ncbi:MAG TPA: hypothetical protein VN445_05300, partial [Rectinemataceae bacterium]|nr:hypothetical protein [Rectinemataceae bacterium]
FIFSVYDLRHSLFKIFSRHRCARCHGVDASRRLRKKKIIEAKVVKLGAKSQNSSFQTAPYLP